MFSALISSHPAAAAALASFLVSNVAVHSAPEPLRHPPPPHSASEPAPQSPFPTSSAILQAAQAAASPAQPPRLQQLAAAATPHAGTAGSSAGQAPAQGPVAAAMAAAAAAGLFAASSTEAPHVWTPSFLTPSDPALMGSQDPHALLGFDPVMPNAVPSALTRPPPEPSPPAPAWPTQKQPAVRFAPTALHLNPGAATPGGGVKLEGAVRASVSHATSWRDAQQIPRNTDRSLFQPGTSDAPQGNAAPPSGPNPLPATPPHAPSGLPPPPVSGSPGWRPPPAPMAPRPGAEAAAPSPLGPSPPPPGAIPAGPLGAFPLARSDPHSHPPLPGAAQLRPPYAQAAVGPVPPAVAPAVASKGAGAGAGGQQSTPPLGPQGAGVLAPSRSSNSSSASSYPPTPALSSASSSSRKGPPSHSEIERKRRDLMTERIGQLKNLLPASELALGSKSTQAAILGSAARYIGTLQAENAQLREARGSLVAQLKATRRALRDLKGLGEPAPPAHGSPPEAAPEKPKSGGGSGSGGSGSGGSGGGSRCGSSGESASRESSPGRDDGMEAEPDGPTPPRPPAPPRHTAPAPRRRSVSRRGGGGAGVAELWRTGDGPYTLLVCSVPESAAVASPSIAMGVRVPAVSVKQFAAMGLKLAMENLFITDPTLPGHPIIYASESYRAAVGMTQEEVVGAPGAFSHPGCVDYAAAGGLAGALRDGADFLAEVFARRKDGAPFWSLVSVVSVVDAQSRVVNYIASSLDITSCKHREGVLMRPEAAPSAEGPLAAGPAKACPQNAPSGDREGGNGAKRPRNGYGPRGSGAPIGEPNTPLKHFLAALLCMAMEGLLVTDSRTRPGGTDRILFASRGLQRATGFSRGELVGQSCSEMLGGEGPDAAPVPGLDACMRLKRPCIAQALLRRKCGPPLPNLLFATPVLDMSGEAVRFIQLRHAFEAL
eukprot:tig00000319_g24129.t1